MSIAKLFINGKSQAIRLPKKYRFQGTEVAVTPFGRGVVIQPIINSWEEVFKQIKLNSRADFLLDREDTKPQEREVLK